MDDECCAILTGAVVTGAKLKAAFQRTLETLFNALVLLHCNIYNIDVTLLLRHLFSTLHSNPSKVPFFTVVQISCYFRLCVAFNVAND
jgi:hypothetical protein